MSEYEPEQPHSQAGSADSSESSESPVESTGEHSRTEPRRSRASGPSRRASGSSKGGSGQSKRKLAADLPRRAGRRAAAVRDASPSQKALMVTAAVPLLTLAAMGVTSGAPTKPPAAVRPENTSLTTLQVVCPAQIAAGGHVLLTSAKAEKAAGVQMRLGETRQTAALSKFRTTTTRPSTATIVDARGGLAPGLVVGRVNDPEAAAVQCGAPLPEYWFTGVGAGSIHASKLELVNPDSGPAIADIEVLGADGDLDVPDVRGVTVPGGTATTIDLAKVAPERHELTLHVSVVRGRLGASMPDTFSSSRTTWRDWLTAQPAPSTSNVLLGLAKGGGQRQLVLSNPSDDEVRAELKVIGAGSTFVPAGVQEISVPPRSTVVKDISKIVIGAQAKEEAGLLITGPDDDADPDTPPTTLLTATLRSSAGDDLSHAVAVPPIHDAGVLLPSGKPTLVLAAPLRTGTATVTSYDATGKQVASKRVEVKTMTCVAVALSETASFVTVTTEKAPLSGAVRVESTKGVVTLPLTDLIVEALVPHVAAGSY